MWTSAASIFRANLKKFITLILPLACLGAFATANVQAADIRVLATGGDLVGNQASNEIFANGDLTGSITRPPWSEVRLISTADLINNYDVYVIPDGAADWQFNVDWQTRLIPFMASGGGVVYESYIRSTADSTGLITGQLGTRYVCADGTICYIPNSGLGLEPIAPVNVLPVAGLTGVIGADFTHTDGYFTSWDAALSPVLDIVAIDLGTIVYGLQGQYDAGRIVITQSSGDLSGLSTGTVQQVNHYNWLVNKIRWTSESSVEPNANVRTVPAIQDYSEADALTSLGNSGIVANIISTTSILDGWGTVASTNPNAGDGIFAGDTLDVFVSLTPVGAPVITPDVRNMLTADATAALAAVGLGWGGWGGGPHPTVPVGEVIAQMYVPGSDNITGYSVATLESSGPDPLASPYLRWVPQTDAETAIIANGMVLGTVTPESHSAIPAGYVISSTFISSGSTIVPINLVVSSGPANLVLISTPNTVGLSLTAARDAVAVAGLIPLIVNTAISATVPAGNVISQNPATGALLAKQSTVNFVISSGTAGTSLVTSPVLAGLSQTVAAAAITGHGLVVGTITFALSSTVADGNVISSPTSAGTLVALASSIDLVIAGTPVGISVPDVVGLAQPDAEADILFANLVVGTITGANSATVGIGDVLSQSPIAASTVATGSSVDLVISLGPVVVVDQTPWTVLLGSTGADYGDDIAIDAAGNSYVSGYTNGSIGGAVFQGGIGDMFVAKFDSSGALMWVNQEGTTEMDRAMRVTLDAAGNTYVTGYTAGDLAGTNADFGSNDYFIAKYNPNGNRLWWNQYGGLNSQIGAGISVAPSGDIYVCGREAAVTATGAATNYAFLTKFDSTGTELWTDSFGADSIAGENCTDVAVGADGFIYMTGATGGCLTAACPGGGDIFVAKYDSAGNQQWLMETGLTGRDYAGKIAVDAAGNTHVSASTTTTLSGLIGDLNDMITVKIDSNGVLQWLEQVGTTTLDAGYGVSVDSNGTVYAVGRYGVGPAIVLVEYDANGNQLSLDTMSSGNGDIPTAIDVDSAGSNYFIAGYTSGDLDGQINAGLGADIFVTHNNPTPVADAVLVAVPNVVGLVQVDAEAAIVAANLVVGTITTANSLTVPAGDVISQNPAAAASVAEGSTVDLVVSLGAVTVSTPNVVGLAQTDAEAAIIAANLVVGVISSANDPLITAGDVISQTPVAGTVVTETSSVDLVISLGPTLVLVATPDVVGLAQTDAEAAIIAANLIVGVITSASDPVVPAGDVISQTPVAGTVVAETSSVDLLISLGPVAVIPPVADAGTDQTVNESDPVTLDGTASSDADGLIVSYAWTQTAGTAVTLVGATTATPSFTAPTVTADELLSFTLVVTDDVGATDAASVNITVIDVPAPPPAAFSYYVLNPRINNSSIQVVSLADGNTITAGGTILNLDQYEVGTIPSANLGQGTQIAGTQPFDIGGNVNNTDMPVPGSFASTQFVLPHYRSTHYYYLLSPNSNASVSINISGSISNLSLTQGIVTFFNAGSSTSVSGVVTSNVPILMTHRTSAGSDAYPVPPATTEVYGVRTNNVVLGAAEDNTSVTVYASNGASRRYNLDAGERILAIVGSSGSEGTGNAIHIVANKPIAAIQAADSDGFEATSFWSPTYAATRFALPVNTQYVAIVCLQANTTITLNDGGATNTQTCSASGQFPAKEFFGSTADGTRINAGATIESNNPIYLIYEASATNDEHNLLGN